MGFFGKIWRSSRHIGIDVNGYTIRGEASSLYFYIQAFFVVVAVLGLLLGFNLDQIDRWLDAQAGWAEIVFMVALKGVLVLILIACALTIVNGLSARVVPKRWLSRPKGHSHSESSSVRPASFGAMFISLVVGYFAYVGLFI